MNLPFKVTDVFWMTARVWPIAETIVHQGGTSSGKTYAILQWLILQAVQEPNLVITVCGQDIPNLRVGALRDIQNIIYSNKTVKSWLQVENKASRTFTFKNGSVIEFNSYDNYQDAKSGKRDYLFVNEANGIPYDIYSELADRTAKKVLLDYNPTAKFWVHTQLLGQPGVVQIITNFEHNQFCPEVTRRRLLNYRNTNERRWKVYGLGLTGVIEGVVYPDVQWIHRFPDTEVLSKFGYGLDYGYVNDPLAFVRAGIIGDRIYAQGLIYEPALKLKQLVEKLEKLEIPKEASIAMDDSQSKEQADLLRDEYHYFVKSAKRTGGSILQGIELLKDYRLYIVDDKEGNWANEQEQYQYPKGHDGELKSTNPIDKANHYWDALRYWALENITKYTKMPYQPQSFII